MRCMRFMPFPFVRSRWALLASGERQHNSRTVRLQLTTQLPRTTHCAITAHSHGALTRRTRATDHALLAVGMAAVTMRSTGKARYSRSYDIIRERVTGKSLPKLYWPAPTALSVFAWLASYGSLSALTGRTSAVCSRATALFSPPLQAALDGALQRSVGGCSG